MANVTEAQDFRHSCILSFRSDLVPYTLVVLGECLFNLLVIVAIAVNRSRLKHNHVYSYVTSVVAANMAMGVLLVYTLVNYMVAFERGHQSPSGNMTNRYDQSDTSQQSIMTWWAFRKAFMVAFFLILSGNVSALIHGIADSAYFVGRSGGSDAKLRLRLRGSGANSSSPTRGASYGALLKLKKKRAYVIITMTWVLPFFYSLPAAFGWNCIEHCDCMPGYYGGYRCISRTDPALCSRVWSPMNNVHMLLSAIIWFFSLIIIGINLFYALHKYYRTSVRPTAHPESTPDREIDDNQGTISRNGVRKSIQKSSTAKEILRRPMHPTVKLLILISVAYTLATAPLMICIVTDFVGSTILGKTLVSDMQMTVISSLVILYCFVCPVILIAYMPGLRSAIVQLLLPCSSTSTTLRRSNSERKRLRHQDS